jgi:hypothetical protein
MSENIINLFTPSDFRTDLTIQFLRQKERQPITKCSSNKGFSGKSSILPRTNFSGGGQENSPQSLTAATLNRWTKPPEGR